MNRLCLPGRGLAGAFVVALRLIAVIPPPLLAAEPPPDPADPATVAVDVGHTLAAVGAISARGRGEFDFNRDLAAHVGTALAERGLAVRPVNADGRIESLQARPQAAAGSDFFLSIHHDSVQAHLLSEWDWDERPAGVARGPHPHRTFGQGPRRRPVR